MSLAQLLIQVAARGTALLLLTALAAFLFRRASAATRHLIWTGGLAVSLVAPLISMPEPVLPVLPSIPAASSVISHQSSVASRGSLASTDAPAPAEVWSGTLTSPAPVNHAEQLAGTPSPVSRLPSVTDWPRAFALVWLAGLIAAGLRLMAGWIAVSRLARHAVPVVAPEWLLTIRSVVPVGSFRRPIRFLESAEVVTPCTWGTLEPVVLLPAVGAGWSSEERRQVVIHELAHVRRFDCATQIIGGLTVALHWFNPLAWYAQRSSRVAREQACDDAVLISGGTASTYASLLLAAAAPEGGPWMPAEAQAMARRSQIGDRLLAVLDPARRRNPVDRRAVGWISVTALAAAIPVAGIGFRATVVPQDTGSRTSTVKLTETPITPVASAADTDTVITTLRAGARPASRAATAATASPVSPVSSVSTAASVPSVPSVPATDVCDPTKRATGKSHSSSTSSYSDDGGDGGSKWYSVTWTGPKCSVSIKARGNVTFTPGEDDVASVSDGGRFEIQSEDGSTSRDYLVTSKNGTLERRYRFNDEDAKIDAEGIKWRMALIQDFIRRTGYDAEARARRIRKQGGVDALVQEIGLINSDGVRSLYLKVALDDPTTTASDAAKFLTLTQGIGSDGDRARVLSSTPVALLSDRSVQQAYASGAKGIGSDGDLSYVIITALSSGKLSAGSCEWVLGLVGNIGSDGDRSRVLVTATDVLEWNSSCTTRALELTREIGSDGDKSRTLIRFLQKHGLPNDLIPVFFQTTATIGSDGDHSSVLRRVIELDKVSDAVVEGVLLDSHHIGSDGDHASVLIAAARKGVVKTEKLKSAYRDSARGIGSDGDRDAAMRALERS